MIHSTRSKSVTPRIGWHQAQFDSWSLGPPHVGGDAWDHVRDMRNLINWEMWHGFHAVKADLFQRRLLVIAPMDGVE